MAAEESTSAAAAPWPFSGLKTKVTFWAAGAGVTARELSADVEFVWAPVDVWVPLRAATLGAIAGADDELVGLGVSAEGKEDDEDEDGKSAACAAADVSVFPSSWPLTHVGRITPVSPLYMNVWLPCAVRGGEF
jgi:hypothetical protein